MLRTSKKKVTFIEKPAVLGGERHALSGQPHSRTLQSFLPLLVKQLSLSPVSYRQLKDGGVVTTEQIGQIELEGCRERKVAKLLEIVKNAELPVFGAFCVVLGEMGYWYLSQTLQSAAKENMLVTEGRAAKNNKDLKEVVLLHKDITHSREANLGLCRKMQYLKCEYDKRLRSLGEMLALVREEREVAEREKRDTEQQSAELRRLNTEIHTLIARLQASCGAGLSVDPRGEAATRPHRCPRVGLFLG
ncbi:uncharacterized protein LOC136755076 isoform X3 [Amia ocellicauda]|uniref:uncharacterized protein LOC136755076 isoform X3 n=1 Tax=Amia ocellicauda TaxID=2972642 RepID=UPI003464416C